MVAWPRQGRGIKASPATDIAVREDAVVAWQETRIEFAGPKGDGDGFLLDGKAGQGQEAIDPIGEAVGGKLDLVAGGVINLRRPTTGAAEPVADFLEGQFLLVPQAKHQRLASGTEGFGLAQDDVIYLSDASRRHFQLPADFPARQFPLFAEAEHHFLQFRQRLAALG